MKTSSLPRIASLVLAAALTSGAAFGLTITPTSGILNDTRWEGNSTANPTVLSEIALITSASELYKQNVGGAEELTLAGSYTTTFNADLSGGTIVYNPPGNIVGSDAYLLVKDGNNSPAYYFFNLTAIGAWNGTETIELSGFWPQQGSISHISLFGTNTPPSDTPPPRVPDGGATVALLGLGLGALALMRRFFSK